VAAAAAAAVALLWAVDSRCQISRNRFKSNLFWDLIKTEQLSSSFKQNTFNFQKMSELTTRLGFLLYSEPES
jgi:hypothetical protein